MRIAQGVLSVAAAILSAKSNNSASGATFGLAVLSAGNAAKAYMQLRQESAMSVENLNELGASLEAEITPHAIELEDRTVMLSGNVEDQYAQWREVLAEIYRTEIGELELPEDYTATTDTL